MMNAPIAGNRTRIDPANAGLWFMLSELWRCRRLLYVFVWRDVKVRYKQTIIGAAWTIVQPLLAMLVFTLVFGRLAKVSSGNVPYPLFVYCGLLPWQFFSQGLLRAGNSLVDNRYLITKVYLPTMVLPLAAILSGVPDFAASFAVLLGLMMYYGFVPGIFAFAVIPLLAFTAVAALALGLFLSALNVRYRDVGYTVPFLAQLWFFVTPVAYPSTLIPDRWREWYAMNPMTTVAEAVRWALLGTTASVQQTGVSLIVVLFVLTLGVLYFHRAQRRFADLV
jgi:lipopolysaccharide transport system permease protein